ncbi:hypothetical protein [Kribbella lupini]|uniref:Uncharacterized protein n=1 Tax=Kribbella lupini TaxID=291602 RepID=A0ABP4LT42_9ACTN
MAKFTTWLDGLLNRIAPLQPTGDYPAQIQRAQDRMDTLDRLADTEPDSLRAAAYQSVWQTMGEELGFVVADLDRGRLNDEALTTAIEQWENYGRAYLAQNAISADTVFPQRQGTNYDPAGDVALARDAIRTDLRQAEGRGDQHRATVLRDFDAQLDKMVELYTLQAADQRAAGRDETPKLDREAFRRELSEHAALFSGKVHPGPEIALPNALFPALSSNHPGLWERHQQLFSATLDWSSNVRHPILNSTQYEPPAAASSAVRDHAAAVHAWALAEAKQARNAGQKARADGLQDFADDVVMVLSQYEDRATTNPGQDGEDLDQLDRHAFGDALDHVAGLGNESLTDDDAIVLPEQLRTGAYELGDDEDPEDVEARLILRRHQLFPGLGQPVESVEVADVLLDHLDNVEDWIRLRPPNLGHRPLIVGLSQQADQAVAAGDFELAARYRELAEQIDDQAQFDEYEAVEGALRAPDRRAHLAEQQTLTEARLQEQVSRHGLVLPDSNADQTGAEPLERDSDQMLENAVQHAYDMIVSDRAAERQFDLGTPSDHDPVDLGQLKHRLALHSRLSDATPYASEQIDQALQRLTTHQIGPRAELLDYNEHGERRPSVRITGDAQYGVAVDAGAGEQARRADDDTAADDHSDRLAELVSAAERAEMNAERLDDADNPAGAARLREQARQWLQEADQLAAAADLGSIYTDTDANTGDELGPSEQTGDAETTGTSDLSQKDVAKWRDRLTASVMEEAARTKEPLSFSSANFASPPATIHAPARETGAAVGRIFQPRVDFDSWLDQSTQHQIDAPSGTNAPIDSDSTRTTRDVEAARTEQGDAAPDAEWRRELDAELEAAKYNEPQRRRKTLARQVDELADTAASNGDAERARRLRILTSDTRHVPYAWDGESEIIPGPWQTAAEEVAEAEVSAGREVAGRESTDQEGRDDHGSAEQVDDDSDELADPASYLTAEQRAAAEAMEAPDLGHARIAERLAQLAGEAAHAGDDEREERFGMLADDVRFAAADAEYNAMQLAAASSDSEAEFVRGAARPSDVGPAASQGPAGPAASRSR